MALDKLHISLRSRATPNPRPLEPGYGFAILYTVLRALVITADTNVKPDFSAVVVVMVHKTPRPFSFPYLCICFYVCPGPLIYFR